MAADLPATIHCKNAGDQDEALPLQMAVVEEIIQGWRDGTPPSVEAALASHPDLQDVPDAVLRLIYEEVCVRRELGESVPHEEIARRFPRWREQLEVLLRCHSILTPFVTPPAWPRVGESVGEFQLMAELGRGGQGRVFLANQHGLGDRPVVLKLTPRDEQEHLTLARLQHTHIVPLYAATDDPLRRLRALCMPFYGGAPLHELLADLVPIAPARRTGQHVLGAMERLQPVGAIPPPSRCPARQFLARASYVEAVCWIGACLAEALEYAHERGLLHLDLKPSNVLLAADGQPMLLDFHLARPPLAPGAPPPQWFGGTPGYMSPEQEQALAEAAKHRPVPQAVDERSDVYALGILLYEALGGEIPVPAGNPVPQLQAHNPAVSVGLGDILRKCLAADPAARYQKAKAVAADLRRHLAQLPLKGVPNRSWAERWQKWRRRQPNGLTLGILGATVAAALVGWSVFGVSTLLFRQRDAQQALAAGRQHLQQRDYGRAVDVLARGSAWAAGLPGAGELRHQLEEELRHARRAQGAQQLHDLADRVRFLYNPTGLSEEQARSVQALWQACWERRHLLTDQGDAQLEPDLEQQIGHDLLDLSLIWAELSAHRPDAEAHQRALDVLNEAEALFGPSHVLYRQRQALAQALGRRELAADAGRRAEELAPRTAWEHYALGRTLLHAGDLGRAADELHRAVSLQPQDFWPNFYEGICAQRRGKYGEAVTAFSVCIALAPDSAECRYNRALALAAQGRRPRALHDYDHVLELDPTMTAALLNRGLLHLQMGNLDKAQADLEQALTHGADPATVHYNLARIHLAQGDRPAALAGARRALAADPDHAGARQLRAQLEGETGSKR